MWINGCIDTLYIRQDDQLNVVPYEALSAAPRMAMNYRKIIIKVNQTMECCQSKLPGLLQRCVDEPDVLAVFSPF